MLSTMITPTCNHCFAQTDESAGDVTYAREIAKREGWHAGPRTWFTCPSCWAQGLRNKFN